jgi:hypothetical protein
MRSREIVSKAKHPAAASLLDDMRFLLAAVHALPRRPSPKEKRLRLR